MKPLIVLDTNVLVSAAISSKSVSYKAFKKAVFYGEILFSKETFQEIENVLMRKKFDKSISPKDRKLFLNQIQSLSSFIHAPEKFDLSEDPKDNMFLDVAHAGKALLIVSGDNDLLKIKSFEGIPIMTPAEFLDNQLHEMINL